MIRSLRNQQETSFNMMFFTQWCKCLFENSHNQTKTTSTHIYSSYDDQGDDDERFIQTECVNRKTCNHYVLYNLPSVLIICICLPIKKYKPHFIGNIENQSMLKIDNRTRF